MCCCMCFWYIGCGNGAVGMGAATCVYDLDAATLVSLVAQQSSVLVVVSCFWP